MSPRAHLQNTYCTLGQFQQDRAPRATRHSLPCQGQMAPAGRCHPPQPPLPGQLQPKPQQRQKFSCVIMISDQTLRLQRPSEFRGGYIRRRTCLTASQSDHRAPVVQRNSENGPQEKKDVHSSLTRGQNTRAWRAPAKPPGQVTVPTFLSFTFLSFETKGGVIALPER